MEIDKTSWLSAIKEADARRPDLPGEHLFVLGAGLALMIVSLRSRSFIGKALVGGLAGALIGRAASGTGGVARLAQSVDELRGRFRI